MVLWKACLHYCQLFYAIGHLAASGGTPELNFVPFADSYGHLQVKPAAV